MNDIENAALYSSETISDAFNRRMDERLRGCKGIDLHKVREYTAVEMTYVVTESCIRCKHTDCVGVCPADCFHEGPNFLVIDPHECIDCGVCVPECPEDAILAEDELSTEQRRFVAINAQLAKGWPVISSKKEPLPNFEEWHGVAGKLKYLEPPLPGD